ncbi:LamG-like jellyroll fold domain-containing protein [Ruania alba]|uniref:LamG-like jellyroll fold domain-containing protein n=1 Tax=Ruania alba TaxID=648782 RepID=UPI0015877388|nr:LamG-like jellyroll fold domain-containing protein [Ruania alba]
MSTPALASPDTQPTVAETASATVPEPDIFSIDFTSEGPVEHTRDRTVTTQGVAPSIEYDESVQRHVADFAPDDDRTSTGTGALVVDIPDAWSTSDPGHVDGADVLDGGTFECFFRYDGDIPVPSGQTNRICSGGPEGYGFYLPATGEFLRFQATSTSAHRNTATAPIPVQPGEWVHAVATVGDGEIKLYLDGQPAWELPVEPGNGSGTGRNHLGPYTQLRVDSVPKWGIGGQPTADGFSTPGNVDIAASRAWSSVLTEEQVLDLWRAERPAIPDVDLPHADVLDVDFSDPDAPFHDHSPAAREPQVTGSADIARSTAFASQPSYAYTTDGANDHAFYPLQSAWADTGMPRTDDISTWSDDTWAGEGITLQCDVMVHEDLPMDSAAHFCAGKSAGGFGLHLSDSSIVASFHINGGYRSVTSAPIDSGVWHSVVATFDGTQVALYVDGTLQAVNSSNTVGNVKAPTAGSSIEPYVRYFAIGSDVKGRGDIESPAAVTVGHARIWSSALSADQAAQLDRDSFGDRIGSPELIASNPAAGSHLTTPEEFDVRVSDRTLATGWQYLLDGEPIELGDVIGAGMAAGDHEIAITTVDVFGRPLDWTIPFTSPNIPAGGGTDTGQGSGAVTLSAIATGSSEQVTTTFQEAEITEASGGVQGTVGDSPEHLGLDFTSDIDDLTEITGSLTPDDGEVVETPATGSGYPFQRYDVELPSSERGQQLLWNGQVDPARMARLWTWDVNSEQWDMIDVASGVADDDTHLQGELQPRMIDTSNAERPVAHVLVTAEDPFLDNLSPRDASAGLPEARDRFEDPEDYDFSFVHYTDQQYTTEVASGSDHGWPSSLPWQHIDGATNTPEESAVFREALLAQNEWIAANQEERSISYVANTGDVINSEVSINDLQFDPEAEDPMDGSSVYDYTTADGEVPGIQEQVRSEYEIAREVHESLWSTGIPNQTVAGNHDNHNGNHNGPLSPFAQFFPASAYYEQAETLWPEDASYHAIDEVTDPDTGEVTARGEDSSNSYVLFSAGGLDFVAVGLSYGATDEEVDWADSVFERFSDRNGILTTHGYLGASSQPDGRNAARGADGGRLYDQVIRNNENVFLVLGGHFHGVGTNVETVRSSDGTTRVVQMLADYQGYLVPAERVFTPERCAAAGLDPATQCIVGTGADAGKIDVDGDGLWDHLATDKLALGASFLRMLQFDTEENTMSVDTYSPFLDDFGATEYDHGSSPKTTPEPIDRYNGAEDNLTVPVNLTTRQTSFATDGLAVAAPTENVIGTQTVASGFPATVTWSGLTEGQRYAWIAVSREAAEPTGVISQFGGTFVATPAGTDTQPPVLTIPEATTVTVGTAFDVLEGVSAVDSTDGDVSDRIEVIGGVDTTSPGVYALTYVVEDTNGNQAIGSRVVTVVEEPTTTASYTGGNRVTVTLTAEDAGAGIGHIEYRFGDESDWEVYSGPFDLKRSDRQLLQYRATSPDGAAEETRCIAFSPGGGHVDVTVAPEDAVCSG